MLEILTVIAILVAPFAGICAYGKIEDRKKTYNRKLDIFKTLMATRATVLSPEHVGALNRIDIEFTEDDEKPIRQAWAAYLDHLSNGPQLPNSPPAGSNEETYRTYQDDYRQYQTRQETWNDGSRDRLATLLSKMGENFGYDFDEGKIKRAAYRPQHHESIELAQNQLLVYAGDVFSGRRPLSMTVENWPEPTEEQRALAERIAESIHEGAHNVRIVEPAQGSDAERNEPEDG